MTTKTIDIEISNPIRPIQGLSRYDALWLLVRYHKRPLGWVWISCEDRSSITAEELQWHIAEQTELVGLQSMLNHQLSACVLPERMSSEHTSSEHNHKLLTDPISIVICTRDRTNFLKECLKGILLLDYPNYEVIVVDNAPSSDDTFNLVQNFPRIRYVRELRPGLDWARNRGIQEAHNSIVAFTDDDACVDKFWLQAINEAFQESEVMAVTGLVGAAELETDAQYLFEFHYGGMGHGLKRKIFRYQQMNEQDLLWASGFGVGVNMAFRKAVFADIGNFDVALDVGTPSGGGGDVEMFHRLVAHEHTLVYEPAMIVWHTHRRELDALRKQIFDNGRSFGAYLLTCARNGSVQKNSIVSFWLYSWFYQWIFKRLLHPGKLPRRLVWIELYGMLLSSRGYFAAQNQARRITARSQDAEDSAVAVSAKSVSAQSQTTNHSFQEVV